MRSIGDCGIPDASSQAHRLASIFHKRAGLTSGRLFVASTPRSRSMQPMTNVQHSTTDVVIVSLPDFIQQDLTTVGIFDLWRYIWASRPAMNLDAD